MTVHLSRGEVEDVGPAHSGEAPSVEDHAIVLRGRTGHGMARAGYRALSRTRLR